MYSVCNKESTKHNTMLVKYNLRIVEKCQLNANTPVFPAEMSSNWVLNNYLTSGLIDWQLID